MSRTVLVTGAAGFIGFHTALRLLRRGDHVVGVDNLNDYYDVTLKEDRLRTLESYSRFTCMRADLGDSDALTNIFCAADIGHVVHLAAQVGVRSSVQAPRQYVDSNIIGFLNVLECCRHHSVQHLVYASSSSVYGGNTAVPFSVHDRVDHPLSLYAATKRSNELMAHSYSHLFNLPTTGLRFFTVYGPWGRPDMAVFLFARAIIENQPIDVFNNGDMVRDFTFVDDVVEGIVHVLERIPLPDEHWSSDVPHPASSSAPYRLYNIGNDAPVRLLDVIAELESALGRSARKNFLPQQPGDMRVTHANVHDLQRDVGYRPTTKLREGIRAFADWFCDYYGVQR